MQVTTGGATSEYYYTADRVGSTILITNTTGGTAATYSYDSYGNTTATTGGTFATSTNHWRYGGGYTDPNGTIKLGARYFNPTTGRFTQPDPSGQESNNYAYAGDNLISNSDPSGRDVGAQVCFGIFWQVCLGAETDGDAVDASVHGGVDYGYTSRIYANSGSTPVGGGLNAQAFACFSVICRDAGGSTNGGWSAGGGTSREKFSGFDEGFGGSLTVGGNYGWDLPWCNTSCDGG